MTDPERIRYPLKRLGKRGEGKWERVSWDEVLDDIAGRVRKALQEDQRKEVMYHVGRPGHELLSPADLSRLGHRRATTAIPTSVPPARVRVTY